MRSVKNDDTMTTFEVEDEFEIVGDFVDTSRSQALVANELLSPVSATILTLAQDYPDPAKRLLNQPLPPPKIPKVESFVLVVALKKLGVCVYSLFQFAILSDDDIKFIVGSGGRVLVASSFFLFSHSS